MICVVTAPIDLANYVDVWNVKKKHPKERVCHLSWGNLSGMGPHETLYLLAHGSPDALENYSADALAKLLVSKGLTKPIKKIKLLACASGIVGRGAFPFCQKLADALPLHGGPRTVVIGFDGNTANTHEDGRTYAKDLPQPQYPNWDEFKSKFMGKYQALDKDAKSRSYGSEATILKNAQELENASKDLFQWLYDNNKLYYKPLIGGKTYGIPGQKF